MKRVLFSMVLLLVASFTFAQEKNVKEAKSIANGVNPDFAKAEELINQALTNPETKDNAETWDVAGLIQRKRSEKEMENAYLRKPYDTLQVYNSALNMCKFYFKCDELAQIPNEKGKIKNKYRKSNSATILAERGNLINGGIQFFNLASQKEGDAANEDNKKALDFFATYIDIAINPMFEKENLLQTDTVLPQIAYYASLAAAKMEDYPSILKYAPYAQDDKEVGKYAMEFISTALKAEGDTVKWIASLKEGIQKYPEHSAAFLIAHISRSGTNHTRYGVFLHILAHIDTYQGIGRAKHIFCQLLCQMRLTHTSRAKEHKGSDGMVRVFQPYTATQDCFGKFLYRSILSYHLRL